jgi:FHS family glucose/mannose:H+ symporter-like MFS transporter
LTAAATTPTGATLPSQADDLKLDPGFGPATVWLYAGMLITGVGTVVLGPLLPHLQTLLRLTDAQSGTLLAAKFVGAFLGGATVRKVRLGIVLGCVLSAVGFAWLGIASTLWVAGAGILISGYGVGHLITAINILAGRRYTVHTGSAISLLNVFWGLGAVLSGALVGGLLPALGLARFMAAYAVFFLVIAVGGELQTSGTVRAANAPGAPVAEAQPTSLPRYVFAFFLAVLFCYGGLETCLGSWMTTYARRYGGAHLLDGQSAVILFWSALALGRLAAAAVLRRVRERTVQLVSMVCATIFAAALLLSHSMTAISAVTLLLGAALAPYFPTIFGILMRWRPLAWQAGMIMAVSGLGASVFLWLTGAVSTHTGSLRLAMTVPLGIALALVVLSARLPPLAAQFTEDKSV